MLFMAENTVFTIDKYLEKSGFLYLLKWKMIGQVNSMLHCIEKYKRRDVLQQHLETFQTEKH